MQQIEKCKENLNENEALVVMDFAENYSCRYHNEVQSAFWDTNQVTIHPMMAYYFVETQEDNGEIKTLRNHAVIGISNKRKHDADSVEMFRTNLRDILKKKNPKINKIYELTDGCASQYKEKTSFAYISQDSIDIERNFLDISR